MKQTEARKKFPIGSKVQRRDGRQLTPMNQVGVVTGHPEYLMALIGRVAFVQVTSQTTGVVLGEFSPNDLVARSRS